MKQILLLLTLVPVFAFAGPMYSPTWGFSLDLPEGYEYAEGDGRDRFSFCGPGDAMFDLVVYNGNYANLNQLVNDVNRKIQNRGNVDFFQYNDKQAAMIKLIFGDYDGWGIAVELEGGSAERGSKPMLIALAYSPADNANELGWLHMSALDSIAPSAAERRYPGPIVEYSFPRGDVKPVLIPAAGANVIMRENDEKAAQFLIEREYNILKYYFNSPYMQAAWVRYYRFIYRDSFARINKAVSAIAQNLGGYSASTEEEKRAFAQRALSFVQDFKYERGLSESDFLNLVTAVTESRGDCDSRAMLWAIILANTNIRSAFMVSQKYSHAMGLAEIAGNGIHFELYGISWIVAETTANLEIGLIAQDVSDPRNWLGIVFE
jgi:hypothetical protein